MTVWLARRPEYVQVCLFSISNKDRLVGLVDTLQDLKTGGVLANPVRLYNDYKFLSSVVQYPWRLTGGKSLPLSGMMEDIRKALGCGPWNGETRLFAASQKIGLAQRELIQQVLESKVDRLLFVDEIALPEDALSASDGEDLTGDFITLPGHPTIRTVGGVRSTYWRKRTPVPVNKDPDRDACGVIWCSPSAPFDGKHFEAVVQCIEETMAPYGFEPVISAYGISERNIIIVASLLFDRDAVGEDARALECHDTLLHRLTVAGYIPYRLGISSMNSLPEPLDDYCAFLKVLKTALDPNDILAPGRYDFRSYWSEEIEGSSTVAIQGTVESGVPSASSIIGSNGRVG
jgi:4-cresol dehydrogenase (hydroxylating)